MNRLLKVLVVPFLVLFLFAGGAMADDITIYDQNPYVETVMPANEDGEVEPGMALDQKWDLEAFILEGTTLSMVGGYNFKDGETGNSRDFFSGDIFISTSKPTYGASFDSSNTSSNQSTDNFQIDNTFGYDFVIDLDFDNMNYNVYAIDSTSKVLASYYYGYGSADESNQASDPWRFDLNGTIEYKGTADLITSGLIEYETGLTNDETGFLGGSHNSVNVGLDFLNADQEFWAHFTMQCGNDNLMGHGTTPVPEPATMLLLGTGLLGLAGASRKKFMKK